MTPEERDVARQRAAQHLDLHDDDCAPGCGPCIAARAILAFVPSGDVSAPSPWGAHGETYVWVTHPQLGPKGAKALPVEVAERLAWSILAAVAEARAIASQGEAGKGGR